MIDNTLTREAVEWFFSRPVNTFKDPARAQKMCEMRLNGATFKEIGEAVGTSASYARESLVRIMRSWRNYQRRTQKEDDRAICKNCIHVEVCELCRVLGLKNAVRIIDLKCRHFLKG